MINVGTFVRTALKEHKQPFGKHLQDRVGGKLFSSLKGGRIVSVFVQGNMEFKILSSVHTNAPIPVLIIRLFTNLSPEVNRDLSSNIFGDFLWLCHI